MKPTVTIDLVSKVFVIGNQNPSLLESLFDNGVIVHSPGLIEYGEDFMVLVLQPSGYRRPGTLVNEESHRIGGPPSKA